MRHIRIIGLCLVAVFALVAVAATSASAAEPEWGACVSVKSKGHYEDSNCTKEAFKENKAHEKKYKGHFEWLPGAEVHCYAQKHGKYKDSGCTELDEKNGKAKGKYEKLGTKLKFKGKGGAGKLTTDYIYCSASEAEGVEEPVPGECVKPGEREEVTSISVECKEETASGELRGTKEVTGVNVAFTGCSILEGAFVCSNASSGEIQVEPLKGELGYITKATHEVGVVLTPATANGEFAHFECGGVIAATVGVGNKTQGSAYEEYNVGEAGAKSATPGEPNGHDRIISPITPVNAMSGAFTQVYTVNSKSENEPKEFEGGPFSELETYEQGLNFESTSSTKWSRGGEEITNVNTGEEPVEIKG